MSEMTLLDRCVDAMQEAFAKREDRPGRRTWKVELDELRPDELARLRDDVLAVASVLLTELPSEAMYRASEKTADLTRQTSFEAWTAMAKVRLSDIEANVKGGA